jgi:hypothetical protein
MARADPSVIERMATRIVRGDAYKAADLDRISLASLGSLEARYWPRARALRAATIIVLRRTEEAVYDARPTDIDAGMEALQRVLLRALSATPADSFLWLALFWRNNWADGFAPSNVGRLMMSYETGPNEGWIAQRRSPVALALYSQLNPKLRDAAATEFAGLVQSYFKQTVAILLGPGWAARDDLLPRLAAVGELQRNVFARELYHAGADVVVPGVTLPVGRPWSR